jgi:hypothetical protein
MIKNSKCYLLGLTLSFLGYGCAYRSDSSPSSQWVLARTQLSPTVIDAWIDNSYDPEMDRPFLRDRITYTKFQLKEKRFLLIKLSHKCGLWGCLYVVYDESGRMPLLKLLVDSGTEKYPTWRINENCLKFDGTEVNYCWKNNEFMES